MKLYYTPGACSHAVHVALREAGVPFELEKVDLQAKKTESGGDFFAINPKGYVPTLVLDDGTVLTEGPVILQYLGDQKPESGLAPAAGTMDRYRLQEWLNFVTAELHKGFGALFNPKVTGESREALVARLEQRLGVVAKRLETSPFLMGERRARITRNLVGLSPNLRMSGSGRQGWLPRLAVGGRRLRALRAATRKLAGSPAR